MSVRLGLFGKVWTAIGRLLNKIFRRKSSRLTLKDIVSVERPLPPAYHKSSMVRSIRRAKRKRGIVR